MKSAIATVAALVLGGLAFLPTTAQANPIDAFGFGARAGAMAGTQTAANDDVGANYYNPAILATFEDITLDIGYQIAFPSLRVSDEDLGVEKSRGMTAGIVGPGKIAGRRVAIGAAFYLPDQHLNRTRTLSSQQPRFVVYDNRPQRIFMSANLALEITDRLFVGGGLAYMSRSEGTVGLDGRIDPAVADLSELELDMNIDLKSIRYVHGGLFFKANPWLDIGASYRGGFALTLDQIFRINGDIGAAGENPIVADGFFELHTVSQDLFQPEEFTIGLDAQLTPRLSLAFDVGLHRWSAFENPAARIAIDLDIGSFNDQVNLPPAPQLPVARFSDIVIPRVAVEWSALSKRQMEVMVRGGYVYEPSPVSWQLGETNFIDNDKHTVSLGGGLILREVTEVLLRPMSIDLGLAMTMLEPQLHSKISPSDSVGSYRSSGRIVTGSISTRWHF